MDKSELAFALNLGVMVFWIGISIDRYFFEFDRTVKRIVTKCMNEGQCVFCGHPMKIIDDREHEK